MKIRNCWTDSYLDYRVTISWIFVLIVRTNSWNIQAIERQSYVTIETIFNRKRRWIKGNYFKNLRKIIIQENSLRNLQDFASFDHLTSLNWQTTCYTKNSLATIITSAVQAKPSFSSPDEISYPSTAQSCRSSDSSVRSTSVSSPMGQSNPYNSVVFTISRVHGWTREQSEWSGRLKRQQDANACCTRPHRRVCNGCIGVLGFDMPSRNSRQATSVSTPGYRVVASVGGRGATNDKSTALGICGGRAAAGNVFHGTDIPAWRRNAW